MIYHPPKWFMYVAIVGLCFLLGLFLYLVFSGQNEAVQNYLKKQQLKQAVEYRAKADSLQKTVVVAIDSIAKDKAEDSIHYIHEKESLTRIYLISKRNYEAKKMAIDTAPVPSVSGTFSVRSMLSDSACKVW